MKHRKNLICILLCMCIFAGIFSACAEEKQPEVPTSDGYEKLAQVFSENATALEMLQTVDLLLEDIAEPTVQNYTEALVTAMVTYDKRHATQLAEQFQTEALLLAEEKEADLIAVIEIIKKDLLAMEDTTSMFKEEIPIISLYSSQTLDLIGHLYGWCELKVLMCNYTIYHNFLHMITKNTTGSCKIAAETLQKCMAKVAQKTANSLSGDTDTGFASHSAFFFKESFFEKSALDDSEYATDSNFQMFVDTALTAITTIEASEAVPIQGEIAWKKAYIDWMESQDFAYWHCEFSLLHLNKDNIPELYSSYSEYDSQLCIYYNDTLLLQDGLEIVSYIEGENYFLSSGGRMDYYNDKVYRFEDGTFILHHTGRFGYIDTLYANEEQIYDYYWDEEKVPQSQYEERLHMAFDEEQAIKLLFNGVGYTEIVKAIILYETNG